MDDTIFIQTEIALIQSEATLGKVISELDLNRVWGKRLFDGQAPKSSETAQLLKTRLQVQPGLASGLISIRAISEEAAEAADIANTTARAYCEYRAEYRRRLTQTALDAVSGKYAKMEQKIAEARGRVEQAEHPLDPALREQAIAGDQFTVASNALRTTSPSRTSLPCFNRKVWTTKKWSVN
jgi:uncharacterized protein involved in exopolysaccharide biosynthesis